MEVLFLCAICVEVALGDHVVHKDGTSQGGTLLTWSSKPIRSDRPHGKGLAITQCLELFLSFCRTLHCDPS